MDNIIEAKELQIERKRFHVEFRENDRGKFLRITEEAHGRRNTIIVPSTGVDEFTAAIGEVLAGELGRGGFAVTPADLHATLVGVQPSLIRVSADPLTYPLHIILRFELELAMVEGELVVADLPGAWREGMRRLLGVEVPSDDLGCLQDVHWGAGSFGYFPSYALGCLIAAQLWEAMEAQIGSREEDLRRGEVAAIQTWLAENVHRHGRRLDTLPLIERVTGGSLAVEPFLRYVAPLAGR